jgi:cytochrome c oxidase subunit II
LLYVFSECERTREREPVRQSRFRLALAIVTSCVTGAGALARTGPAAKVIDVTASRYRFEPAQIEVDEGDRVVLRVRSVDGPHGLAIKGFKVKAQVPEDGSVITLEFVARKPGVFEFACNEYCGPGHARMRGSLVVKAKVG